MFSLEELPVEQRLEDALAECWETATLKEPLAVLGFAEVHLQLSCDRPCAQIAARLCDVFPNGESSLITRGRFTLLRETDTFTGQFTKMSGHPTTNDYSIMKNAT